MTGKVNKIMPKGFGFITPDNGEKDVFFHANSLVGFSIDDIREGDTVSFEVEQSEKGPNAINVQKA